MSVRRDTSHSPISPYKRSPLGDSLMDASTALLSSALESGENPGNRGLSSRAEFKILGQVERKHDGVRVEVCSELGRVRAKRD